MTDFRQSGPGGTRYRTVSRTQDVLASARLNYQRAFEAAVNESNSDAIATLRDRSRSYAQTFMQHSNAVMYWLLFVDARARNAENGVCALKALGPVSDQRTTL